MELKHGYYHLIAILTVAIWGLTFISTKVLINHGLTPQEIFFYRFLIAYLGIWVISPKRLFTNNWQDELWLVAGGIFGGSLYFFTENTALGITQASNVSFIICTAPLLTTILSLLFYKSEKASKGLIYGSLLALMGVGLIVFNGSFVLKISPIGDLLTLLAALSWAFYSIYHPQDFLLRSTDDSACLPPASPASRYRCTSSTCRSVQPSVSGRIGFADLLCTLECGVKTVGNGTGIQLYLSQSSGHDDCIVPYSG